MISREEWIKVCYNYEHDTLNDYWREHTGPCDFLAKYKDDLEKFLNETIKELLHKPNASKTERSVVVAAKRYLMALEAGHCDLIKKFVGEDAPKERNLTGADCDYIAKQIGVDYENCLDRGFQVLHKAYELITGQSLVVACAEYEHADITQFKYVFQCENDETGYISEEVEICAADVAEAEELFWITCPDVGYDENDRCVLVRTNDPDCDVEAEDLDKYDLD